MVTKSATYSRCDRYTPQLYLCSGFGLDYQYLQYFFIIKRLLLPIVLLASTIGAAQAQQPANSIGIKVGNGITSLTDNTSTGIHRRVTPLTKLAS